MADFPERGTACGECGCCPASVFSGGMPVCWECDEGKPCKHRGVAPIAAGVQAKAVAAAHPKPVTAPKPKPAPKPRKAPRSPMVAIPPKPELQQAAARLSAARTVVSDAVASQAPEPEASAKPHPAARVVSAAETELHRLAEPPAWAQPPAPPPDHYAAVIADLEEKRADLVADLEAIDRCLPILRVIEARKPATANHPERLHAQ